AETGAPVPPGPPAVLRRSRRWALVACVAAALSAGGAALTAALLRGGHGDDAPRPEAPAAELPPIKVGVLQSTTGTLGDGGSAVVDATLLALDEVNQRGGVRGRRVEAVFRDGRSDPAVYAREAERLIVEDGVCTIFGCYASANRKAVKEVVERHGHLLLYPMRSEGLEQSPNIVYLGQTPNQQVLPAVQYCYTSLKKRRFFLVGTDCVYARTANALVRDALRALGAETVGEEYLPAGSADATEVVRRAVEAGPDVILNTIIGDGNRAFFRALRAAGVTPDKVPTVSFSVA